MKEGWKENIYIYIDESGDVTPINKGGKSLFLIGCVITDDPISLNNQVSKLKEEIKNNAYYFRHIKKFNKEGFHASTNHPDIYARFVSLINTLNFRGYVVFADKTSDKFLETLEQNPNFYYFLLKILLKDRILKRKDNNIHIVIEQSSTKHNLEKKVITSLLKEINESLINEGLIASEVNITFDIQGKNKDAGVDVVDYLNHIIFSAKTGDMKEEIQQRYKENLNLIEPKIALVYNIFNKKYYGARKKPVSLFNFLNSV